MNKSLEKKTNPETFFKYKQHLFICGGEKCCKRDRGEQLWEFTKACVRASAGQIHRTQVKCLRYCKEGPVGVLYPSGIWLKNLDEAGVQTFVDTGAFPPQYVLASRWRESASDVS